MTKLTILGTAAALPDPGTENTYMVVQGNQSAILIDCAGSPIQRLHAAGVPLDLLDGLILTHHHPDHIYGVSPFFLGFWLSGRKAPFHVYAPARTLHAAQGMMELLEWDDWPHRPAVHFHEIPLEPNVTVLDGPEFTITASPGKHMLPVVSLRIHSKESGGVLTYCCDTEPTPETTALAHGADIVIHECAGEELGHTGPRQAGAVAAQAETDRLVLIHYSLIQSDEETMLSEAGKEYAGPVELA